MNGALYSILAIPSIREEAKAMVNILYCKVPKFSDVGKLCCSLPKIQEKRQSDLGLHCLPRPICPKTLGHYGIL